MGTKIKNFQHNQNEVPAKSIIESIKCESEQWHSEQKVLLLTAKFGLHRESEF